MKKTAILLGATGLTGSLLLNELIGDEGYEKIKLFSRKKIDNLPSKVVQIIGDIANLEKFKNDFTGDVVFCCIGTTAKKTPDKVLYKNIDYASFEDITSSEIQNDDRTYGIAWGDFNNDLLPDMFTAPCHPFNPGQSVKHLYLNNGDDSFTDINVAAGVNDSLASWGVIWRDYNNDALLDLVIANMRKNPRPGYNKLYRNT